LDRRRPRMELVVKDIRTRPVIGVFGSSDPTKPGTAKPETAEEIGYQLAMRGRIVLTGGDGSVGDAVRDRAIMGARCARRARYDAAWVGVARTRDPGATEHTESHIILRPGYEHKRNYVEAHLCDAAIALPGSKGTPSEVAFCLVLGRPLVLVGPVWEAEYGPLEGDCAAALTRFQKVTMDQMKIKERKSPLDEDIKGACSKLTEHLALPALRYRPLPDETGVGGIIDCVLELADQAGLSGSIPKSLESTTMAEDYRDWLAQLQPPDDGHESNK